MSTTIDQRVVEMRFDNQHFERNVATTMSTLGKLKQSLKLPDASKGLDSLSTAAKKVDMNSLSRGVEDVRMRFSALEVMGVTALANITNSAVNAGKRIVSALTIDPVKTGFQEYETQINAVQTILSNTKSKGTTIDDVNRALDELNKYADMTIYNFTEMTRNIGTFTAAGVDLETSVGAIQGIANLAAQSGSTSQQASTAMYQLSQALAAGKVQLMDWNSVVNAGMGGEMFQNALRETSELLGTGAEAAIEASGSFRESLRDGWLTADVLTETLKKFTTSGANEYVAKYTELSIEAVEAAVREGEAVSKAAKARGEEVDAIEHAAEALAKKSGKDKEEIFNMLDFARSATDAATKVKTFTQLWDVLKESAQSGWSQTWKLIVGDFEEARDLFTPLADTLTGFINKMSDWRNNILQIGLDFAKPWTTMMEKLDGAGLGKIKKIADSVGDLSDKLEYYQNVVTKVWRGDYKNSDTGRYELLDGEGYDHRVVQDLVNKGYQYKLTVEDIEASHKKFGIAVKSSDKEVKKSTASLEKLSDQKLKDAGLTEEEIRLYRALEDEAAKHNTTISKLAEEMSEVSGRDLLIDSFKNFGSVISGVGKAAKDAWVEIFDPPGVEVLGIRLYGVIKSLNEFSERIRITDEKTGKLTETGEKIKRTFEGIFAVVDIVATILGGPLKLAFTVVTKLLGMFGYGILDITAIIGDTLVGLHDFIEGIFNLDKLLEPVARNIESAAKAFKEWFGGLKDAEDLPKYIANGIAKGFKKAIENVKTFLKSIRDLFKNGFTGLDDSPITGFVNKIKNGLGIAADTIVELGKILLNKVNEFLSAKGFEEISFDCIAGLVNGLKSGASAAWDAAVAMAKGIVQKVKDFLGIQSPSTVFMAIGGFIIAGLIAGLQNGIPTSLQAFIDMFQPMIDWVKGLDLGIVIAGVLGVGLISAFKRIGTLIDGIGGIGDILDNASDALGGLGKLLNSVALDFKADAVKKFATSLAILIGAIVLLGYACGREDVNMWNAVVVVGALAGILIGIAAAMSAMSKAGVVIGKGGIRLKSMTGGLIGIAAALLIIALTAKLIGGIDEEAAVKGFLGIGAIIVAIAAVMASCKLLANGDISGVGKTIYKISVAMLMLVLVAKLIATMSWGDMGKAAIGLSGLAGIIALMMLTTKLAGKDIDNIGGTIRKISVAMLMLVLVAKLIATMSWGDMGKAAIGMMGFVAVIGALTFITNLMGPNATKMGLAILGIASAIFILAMVARIIAEMSTTSLIKGLAFITLFGLIVEGLFTATAKAGPDAAKAGLAILAISVAIGILAVVALMLGMVKIEYLAKGIIVVSLLAGLASAMIIAARGVGDCEKAMTRLAIIIGIMAGSVYLLSTIKPEKLVPATVAIVSLMGMFALMAKVSNGATVNVKFLLSMAGVMLVLTGIAYLLSKLKVKSTLPAVESISLLLLALSGCSAILSKFKVDAGVYKAIGAIAVLGLVVLELGLVLSVINKMDIGNAIPAITAISVLLGVLSLCLFALSNIKVDGGTFAAAGALAVLGLIVIELGWVLSVINNMNIKNAMPAVTALSTLIVVLTGVLAALTGLGAVMSGSGFMAAAGLGIALTALAVLGLIVIELGWVVKKVNSMGVGEAMPAIKAISTMLIVLTGVLAACTVLGAFAGAALAGIGVLAVFIVGLTALLWAIGKIASDSMISTLDKGIEVITTLATGLGSAIGEFIGSIGESLTGSLPTIGQNISDFMGKLAEASKNASGIESGSFDGVSDLVTAMGEIALMTVGTSLSDLFTFGGSSMDKFETDGVAFFNAMKTISAAAAGVTIDNESMKAIISVATDLADLQSSLDPIGGVMDWFTGRDDLATFGLNVGSFIGSMKTAFSSLDGTSFNTESLTAIVEGATQLSKLQSSLEPIGGVVDWFSGRDDLATFGTNIGQFIDSMKTTLANLDGVTFDKDALSAIISAATDLAGLQSSLEPIGGVVDWFTGRDDLATFGTNVGAFVGSMKTALANLEGATLDPEALKSVISAATDLAGLQSKLEPIGGVVDWFTGRDDLGTFGDGIAAFATAMGKLKEGMGEDGISENVVTSVTNAGNALIALNNALPEEGFFDSKITMTEFADYISDFSTAISDFSTTASEINSDGINTAINAAYRIKSLIDSIADIDISGVATFTGIGTGGIGADGPMYDIAKAIVSFSDKVAEIDTTSVTTAVTTATKLKSLINGLVDLDTTGIESFKKAKDIGGVIGDYADNVGDIDTGALSSSISAANRLKNFINGLADIDTSGISKFKVSSIGSSLKSYAGSVADVKTSSITSSVSAANKLKNFISSLSDLDTSGVGSFTTAVSELGSVSIESITNAFNNSTTAFTTVGSNLVSAIANGMSAKQTSLVTMVGTLVNSIHTSVLSKTATFLLAGSTLMTMLATGMSLKKTVVATATASAIASAISGIRLYYTSFYSAGSYLVTGFANGISANAYRAAAKARAMAKAAKQAAEEALGIASPSRVFYKIGEYTGQGFVNALGDYASKSYSAGSEIATSARNGLSNAIGRITDFINGDMDVQPTIRPVLDLSDVETGANTISSILGSTTPISVLSGVNAISATMNRRNQNGEASEIVSAIEKLRKEVGNVGGTSYNINGVTYGDDTTIAEAVRTIVRAAKIERRV